MIRKPLHAVILLLSNCVPILHPKTSLNLFLSRLQAQPHGTSQAAWAFGGWRRKGFCTVEQLWNDDDGLGSSR